MLNLEYFHVSWIWMYLYNTRVSFLRSYLGRMTVSSQRLNLWNNSPDICCSILPVLPKNIRMFCQKRPLMSRQSYKNLITVKRCVISINIRHDFDGKDSKSKYKTNVWGSEFFRVLFWIETLKIYWVCQIIPKIWSTLAGEEFLFTTES
jgi:hypothetical protein